MFTISVAGGPCHPRGRSGTNDGVHAPLPAADGKEPERRPPVVLSRC